MPSKLIYPSARGPAPQEKLPPPPSIIMARVFLMYHSLGAPLKLFGSPTCWTLALVLICSTQNRNLTFEDYVPQKYHIHRNDLLNFGTMYGVQNADYATVFRMWSDHKIHEVYAKNNFIALTPQSRCRCLCRRICRMLAAVAFHVCSQSTVT